MTCNYAMVETRLCLNTFSPIQYRVATRRYGIQYSIPRDGIRRPQPHTLFPTLWGTIEKEWRAAKGRLENTSGWVGKR